MTRFNAKDYFTTFASTMLLLSTAGASIILPQGNGNYSTSITTAELIDSSRLDPYAPDNSSRAIMVSVFQPVQHSLPNSSLHERPYMPPTTAQFAGKQLATYGIPNVTLERFRLLTTSHGLKSYKHDSYPIVLFSPGLTSSRLFYSAMAQSIASHGFTVITIDHPYDADIVEFPNGTLVFGSLANINTTADLNLAVSTRAQDASFILDQLTSSNTVENVIPGTRHGLNVSKVGMVGHSLGGASTAAAMLNDKRIAGGVNMDGALHGPVVQEGLDRPFLILSHPTSSELADPRDASWKEIWPRLSGWKRELGLEGSGHVTFSDYSLLLKMLGLGPFEEESVIGELLGMSDGGRAFEVVVVYLVRFLEFVLKGKGSYFLDRPSQLYPEMSLVH